MSSWGCRRRRFFQLLKIFDLPAGSELEKSLEFEIPPLVPDGGEKSKVDWAILDKDITNQTKKDVFVCSSDNRYIEQRLEVLESINLNVLAFETRCFGFN